MAFFSLIFWIFIIWVVIHFIRKKKRIKEKEVKTDEEGMNKRWREMQSSILHEGKVVEKWGGMLDNVGGHGEQLIENITRRIQNDNIPYVVVSKREITTVGDDKTRSFVVVSNTSEMLKPYEILIHASDYGNRLNVLWYVVFERSAKIDKFTNGLQADQEYNRSMAENEALGGYVSIVRGLFDNELKEMMEGLNLDFTKVDTKTRGFGNIS